MKSDPSIVLLPDRAIALSHTKGFSLDCFALANANKQQEQKQNSEINSLGEKGVAEFFISPQMSSDDSCDYADVGEELHFDFDQAEASPNSDGLGP